MAESYFLAVFSLAPSRECFLDCESFPFDTALLGAVSFTLDLALLVTRFEFLLLFLATVYFRGFDQSECNLD